MYEKKYKTLRDEYPGSSALSSPWVHALLAHNIGAASQVTRPELFAFLQLVVVCRERADVPRRL